MEAFSKRLRLLRLSAGKKQEDLCEDLNLSRGVISAYEHGREPSFDTLVTLARYFGVTTDYLLGLSEDRNQSGDELSFSVDKAAQAATARDIPAVTSSRVAWTAGALASALESGSPGAAEAAALARRLIDGLGAVLEALPSGSTARVLDSVNALLACVTDVNAVLAARLKP